MIPFFSFIYKKKEINSLIIESLNTIIDSENYVLGNNTLMFEKRFSKLTNSKFSLGVASGLDALIISLKALGVKKGDEVIVPSNTYIASWLAVSDVGAKIITVEPDRKTYNIDPNLIENKITSKTKAIMPVHLYGQPCNMSKIMEIAQKNNLYVVEDNAQAHIAKWGNQFTGTFGNINATSFYPTKNLGAIGEAGAITTCNKKLYDYALKYRNYGSSEKYINEIKGSNSRIDEMQAAILNIKLNYLIEMTNERVANAKYYNKFLSDVDVTLPYVDPNAEHVYHLFVIRHKKRDALKSYLQKNGVQTSIHYPKIPQNQTAYSKESYLNPIAKELADTSLSLPIYPGLGKY